MKAKGPFWYRQGWSLDIKNQSWVEETEKQVAFLIKTLGLTRGERILDLACGYGRHALSLAQKGFEVVGVDITKAYVDDAAKTAAEQGLPARFIHGDIRDVPFCGTFDVVLNMADGAIGYLENDEENLKIFDVISRALKKGGKHFMDICSAEHADLYFPKTNWEIGEKSLALAQFDWNPGTRRMVYGGWNIPYGQVAEKPDIPDGDPIRLYTPGEVRDILARRGMEIAGMYADYDGGAYTSKTLQMLVYSVKV